MQIRSHDSSTVHDRCFSLSVNRKYISSMDQVPFSRLKKRFGWPPRELSFCVLKARRMLRLIYSSSTFLPPPSSADFPCPRFRNAISAYFISIPSAVDEAARELSRLLYASNQSVQCVCPTPTGYKRTVSGLAPVPPGGCLITLLVHPLTRLSATMATCSTAGMPRPR